MAGLKKLDVGLWKTPRKGTLEKGFQHLVCFILSAGSYKCVVQVLGFKEEGKISKQMVKFLADTPKESWVEVLGCVAVPPNGEDGKPIPITGTSQQVPIPKNFCLHLHSLPNGLKDLSARGLPALFH